MVAGEKEGSSFFTGLSRVRPFSPQGQAEECLCPPETEILPGRKARDP